jgi:hypothetical protein
LRNRAILILAPAVCNAFRYKIKGFIHNVTVTFCYELCQVRQPFQHLTIVRFWSLIANGYGRIQ